MGSALELLRDWFPNTPGQSGLEYSLTLAPRYTLNSTTTLGLTGTTGAQLSQVGFLGEHSYGLGIYCYNQEFSGGVTLNARCSRRCSAPFYGAQSPVRHRPVRLPRWRCSSPSPTAPGGSATSTPHVGYSHTQNRSNISLFTYNSDQVLFGFQHEY